MGLFDDPLGYIADAAADVDWGAVGEKALEIGVGYVQGELKAKAQKKAQRDAERAARRAERRGGPVAQPIAPFGPTSGTPEATRDPWAFELPWPIGKGEVRENGGGLTYPAGWPEVGYQWGGDQSPDFETGGVDDWPSPTAGEIMPTGGSMSTEVGFPIQTLPSGQPWTLKGGRMVLLRQRPATVEMVKARMIATPAGPMLVPARRRMNPLNMRALSRAMRRTSAAERIVRRLFRFHKSGIKKKRGAVGRRKR